MTQTVSPLGARARAIMDTTGWTRSDLASVLQVSRPALDQWLYNGSVGRHEPRRRMDLVEEALARGDYGPSMVPVPLSGVEMYGRGPARARRKSAGACGQVLPNTQLSPERVLALNLLASALADLPPHMWDAVEALTADDLRVVRRMGDLVRGRVPASTATPGS